MFTDVRSAARKRIPLIWLNKRQERQKPALSFYRVSRKGAIGAKETYEVCRLIELSMRRLNEFMKFPTLPAQKCYLAFVPRSRDGRVIQ